MNFLCYKYKKFFLQGNKFSNKINHLNKCIKEHMLIIIIITIEEHRKQTIDFIHGRVTKINKK